MNFSRLILLLIMFTCGRSVMDVQAQERQSQSMPMILRDTVRPHWFAAGTKFWYRNELIDGRREFILVDAEQGVRTAAFDHARVAQSLSRLLEREITATKLPVESLKFTDDLSSLILLGRGQAWKLDLKTHELTTCPLEEIAQLADVLEPSRRPRPTRRTGAPTTIRFINQLDSPVEIYWMDNEGEKQHYASVASGASWQCNTYDGHVWMAMGKDDKPLGVYEARAEPSTAILDDTPTTQSTRPTQSTQPASRPASAERPRRGRRGNGNAISPDGQWVAFVRDYQFLARNESTGDEIALSKDGRQGDAYSPADLWWSPDSMHLVAFRTEPAQEHKVYLVESSPDDQLQPKLRTIDYLKPGDRIAHPRVQLFDVTTRKQIAIDAVLFPNPWSIQDVRWAADSSRFTFVYNQRGHQVLQVVSIDASTGAAHIIVDERSGKFIDYSGKFFCHWINDDEVIWMSERDGWNHLWLYDAREGKVRNQITRGEWIVQEVVHVDADKRQIWFRAGGIVPAQDPYYAHFCRVNFDGTGLVVLTEGDGHHVVQWNAGDRYFIDTFSRVDLPPITQLRSSETGKLICDLEQADASAVLASRNGRWPARFVAKGRDGITDIFGVILFPRDFDPKRKYPVVEQIYAGPQGFFTPKTFRARYGTMQELADRGMIVVQCDGMGTSGRSRAFHEICWKNLRDAGFPDRIAWIKSAANEYPQMDLSRVGIYGGSAGGQNAMAALLWHNDFYHVAVADCGCHDNRMDKLWWNEQWMGWPVDKSYEESSNVVNAHLMQGKLMLIVGELDSNVDPASTMQAARALQKANKDFELVVIPSTGHGAAGTPYGSRKQIEFLVRHLIER